MAESLERLLGSPNKVATLFDTMSFFLVCWPWKYFVLGSVPLYFTRFLGFEIFGAASCYSINNAVDFAVECVKMIKDAIRSASTNNSLWFTFLTATGTSSRTLSVENVTVGAFITPPSSDKSQQCVQSNSRQHLKLKHSLQVPNIATSLWVPKKKNRICFYYFSYDCPSNCLVLFFESSFARSCS